MAVALPMGIMAAIYLNEYAGENRTTWLIEMAINNLAGTPSVVFGLFGLALFVKYFGFGSSLLVGLPYAFSSDHSGDYPFQRGSPDCSPE